MKKVLVVQGQSRYRVLNVAADRIAEGIIQKGYDVEMMIRNESISFSDCQKMLDGDYNFIFSCQAIAFDAVMQDKTPFLNSLNKPYFGWLFDDPLFHGSRVQNAVCPESFLFFIDKSFPDYARMMYPGIKNAYYLPHGGFRQQAVIGDHFVADYKDIDILFSGNIAEKRNIDDYADALLPIEMLLIKEGLKILEKHPWYCVRQALELVLHGLGEELTGELLSDLSNVIQIVDYEIRYQCKYQILESLLKKGFIVHVIGDGSSELTSRYPGQVVVHGGLDIESVVQLIGRSRIVINPAPMFPYGIHERIATALLAHSVCFTPYSPFLENEFDCRLEFIDLMNLDGMLKRMREILDNFTDYIPHLENNYRIASESHTWERRGMQLADFYEQIVCGAGSGPFLVNDTK